MKNSTLPLIVAIINGITCLFVSTDYIGYVYVSVFILLSAHQIIKTLEEKLK